MGFLRTLTPLQLVSECMTRYVISDHHFNHENIIEYTDRPFTDLSDMNTYMEQRWEEIVGDDDVVLYGGDIVMGSGDVAVERVTSLPGTFLYVQGNHDGSLNAEQLPFPMVEDTIVQHDGYRFWYTHRPENVPDDWTEWVLHGHTHNKDPFIDYDNRRVNVCVEAVDYTPVPLPQLTKALSSMGNGEQADTLGDSPIQHHQWHQELSLSIQ